MYASINFKAKKDFKEAIANGKQVTLFAPGLGRPNDNGTETVEGPWNSHKWYANVTVENGIVTSVK